MITWKAYVCFYGLLICNHSHSLHLKACSTAKNVAGMLDRYKDKGSSLASLLLHVGISLM